MQVLDEEWPDVIGEEEPESREEYGRVSEAVGELTSSVLDCKMKGLVDKKVAKILRGYLTSILDNLEEGR
jgi:hypothetical protein